MIVDKASLKEIIDRTSHPLPPPQDFGYQSACVFLLLFNPSDPRILAIQKRDTEGYPWRNQVALPGGHIDKNDTSSLGAAYRELEEEVGIKPSDVDHLGSIGHFQTILKKDIEAFVGIWNEKGTLHFDTGEISRILQLPLRELVDFHQSNDFSGRIPDIGELIYPVKDVTVWGLTARIFHYLIELLHPA